MKFSRLSFFAASILFLTSLTVGSSNSTIKTGHEIRISEVSGNKFLYFGFGSNLLLKRILINNKTAKRKTIGKLSDYELDFYGNSTRWQGAPATIVPKNGKFVWGAVWEIDLDHMIDLDNQESVHEGVYIPINVSIETVHKEVLMCRAYRLTKLPPFLAENEERPYNRQPSATYLKTILKGAIESDLPDSYVDYLRRFKHNGKVVDSIEQDLDLVNIII